MNEINIQTKTNQNNNENIIDKQAPNSKITYR